MPQHKKIEYVKAKKPWLGMIASKAQKLVDKELDTEEDGE